MNNEPTEPKKDERRIDLCICGQDISDPDVLIDSLYPSNRERTQYNICCQIHNCGCGRTVYGDTAQAAIDRWNNGETDEYDEPI